MSSWAIVLCALLYLLTAYDLARKGEVGLALTFFFYACANGGLLMTTLKG